MLHARSDLKTRMPVVKANPVRCHYRTLFHSRCVFPAGLLATNLAEKADGRRLLRHVFPCRLCGTPSTSITTSTISRCQLLLHLHFSLDRSLYHSPQLAHAMSLEGKGKTVRRYFMGTADLAIRVLGEFKDSIPIPAVGLLITGATKILEIAKVSFRLSISCRP